MKAAATYGGFRGKHLYRCCVDQRSIGPPIGVREGASLHLPRSVDAGHGFRAAGGLGRASCCAGPDDIAMVHNAAAHGGGHHKNAAVPYPPIA